MASGIPAQPLLRERVSGSRLRCTRRQLRFVLTWYPATVGGKAALFVLSGVEKGESWQRTEDLGWGEIDVFFH